jgi:hypothetical protein
MAPDESDIGAQEGGDLESLSHRPAGTHEDREIEERRLLDNSDAVNHDRCGHRR